MYESLRVLNGACLKLIEIPSLAQLATRAAPSHMYITIAKATW